MSGGLAPSKSTVYVSNLPFTFTNNDLHKVFEQYGKVVKVTVVKDKMTRKSKGVAFVLYLERESAYAATRAINNKQMFGRILKCSIAVDNGRASEFIKRRDYTDKSRCYECGEVGHLSYMCPTNALGEREPPKKKPRKRRKDAETDTAYGDEEEDVSDEGEDPALESLSAAISFQRELMEEEEYRVKVATGNYGDDPVATEEAAGGVDQAASASSSSGTQSTRKRTYKTGYFSDEEEEEADDNN